MIFDFKPLILGETNIIIRRFDRNDADSIVHHANNPKIYKMLSAKFKQPYTKEDAISWIDNHQNISGRLGLAITIDDKLAGGIGFRKNDLYPDALQLGYWLGEDFWGKGIMTNIVQHMVHYVFEQEFCKKIIAFTFLSNHPSMRVLEKTGFEKKETSPHETDLVLYLLSRQSSLIDII